MPLGLKVCNEPVSLDRVVPGSSVDPATGERPPEVNNKADSYH